MARLVVDEDFKDRSGEPCVWRRFEQDVNCTRLGFESPCFLAGGSLSPLYLCIESPVLYARSFLVIPCLLLCSTAFPVLFAGIYVEHANTVHNYWDGPTLGSNFAERSRQMYASLFGA